MNNRLHLISGLPRSGSTLLSTILRQNPMVRSRITSPLGGLYAGMIRQMSQDNETAVFISDEQRKAILTGLFENYYGEDLKQRIVFDTNRIWSGKMPGLKALFPNAKAICCVRHVPWILDSLERLVQRNPLEMSRIYNSDPTSTVYSRFEHVGGGNGLVGYAWNALREGIFGPHKESLMLLQYETLATEPERALRAVYAFIEEPYFEHTFDNLASSEDEFDARLGAPGLHTIRPIVAYEDRRSILPPDLIRRVESDSFWRRPDAAAALGVQIV